MYSFCIRVCVSWIVGIVLKTTLQLGQLREKRKKIRIAIRAEDVRTRSVQQQQQQQEEDRKMLVENMLSARTSAYTQTESR